MTELLQQAAEQSVPLYLALTPLAATLYLLAGAVACGLGKRYLGDGQVETPDLAYFIGYLIWPLVLALLLVALVVTVAHVSLSTTLIPLSRKIGGEVER